MRSYNQANRIGNKLKAVTSPAKDDGREKWIDFVSEFWHCECISSLTDKVFSEKYQKWCKKNGYNFSAKKVKEIYDFTCKCVPSMPKNDITKMLISQAVLQLNSLCQSVAVLKNEMLKIAERLPEWNTVINMHGVGKALAPQIIAEIGDIRNFRKRTSLACFAGIFKLR